MMQKALLLAHTVLILCLGASGQSKGKKEIKEAWKDIPANIEECMNRLDIVFSDTAKKDFAAKDEKTSVSEYNIVQGMAIRNNWGLWRGSVLSAYFNSYKIGHPEAMTAFILTSYHRKLNGIPIDFEGQLREYFALVERLKARPPKATDYFKIGDTVLKVRFESRGMFRDMFGKQPGYEIKAVVEELDTIAQKFRLVILQINRTDTREKEEVSQYKYNKQVISRGTVFWTDVAWWRKPGQLIEVHMER